MRSSTSMKSSSASITCVDALRSWAVRTTVVATLALAFAGCAVAPPESVVQAVQIDARKITLKHSAFNARMAGETATVNQTFAASLDPKIETLTRLESSYTRAFGSKAEGLRIGDSVSSVGMWGSTVRFGGMQLGTNSATRGDVVTSQQLATSGVAALPTVADALFASLGTSGALNSQQISVDRSLRPAGLNGLGLTAKDALGRSVAIDAPIITNARLVDSGCNDFSVGLGKVREDYAITSNEYGPLFANTTVTCGAPLGFTVEGHGEYLADEVAAFGVGVARQLGIIGTASVAVASSHAELGSGWLARVGFEHRNQWFNFAVRSRMQSRDFREIHSIALLDPIMQRDLASIGVKVAEGANLSLAYATQTTWARERANLISLRQSLNLGKGSLAMSAGHSLVEDIGSSVFISYQRPLGTLRRARSPVEEFDLQLLTRPIAQ